MANTPELKPFVITRSIWDRGNHIGRLWNGRLGRACRMCCLGQFAERVAGIPKSAMSCHLDLAGLPDGDANPTIAKLLDERRYVRLQMVNDAMNMTEPEREREVAAHFAELGYAVTFED